LKKKNSSNSQISLTNIDSYILTGDDLLFFQHRLLDTDFHVISSSLMSSRVFVNATDVLHAFTVVSSGVKVDAIVGRINDMTMYILRENLLFGQCSELCGVGHSNMPVALEALLSYFFLGFEEDVE